MVPNRRYFQTNTFIQQLEYYAVFSPVQFKPPQIWKGFEYVRERFAVMEFSYLFKKNISALKIIMSKRALKSDPVSPCMK